MVFFLEGRKEVLVGPVTKAESGCFVGAEADVGPVVAFEPSPRLLGVWNEAVKSYSVEFGDAGRFVTA